MQTLPPNTKWYTDKGFVARREKVIKFIRERIEEQGANKIKALTATQCIYFWSSLDVENLYRCINSDLPQEVINAIVAHDYNGLAREDKCFLPKSSQFGDK